MRILKLSMHLSINKLIKITKSILLSKQEYFNLHLKILIFLLFLRH